MPSAQLLDAKYAAFQEHAAAAGSPAPIQAGISTARASILAQLQRESAAFAVTSVSGPKPVQRTGPYQLEWTADFPAPSWQLLTNPVATPGILTLHLERPPAPAFFRVREP